MNWLARRRSRLAVSCRHMKQVAIVVVVAAIALGHARAARADVPDDRCEQLRRRLEREHDRVIRWRYTWAIVLGAGAIAQGIAAPLVNDHVQRDTLYVGAV